MIVCLIMEASNLKKHDLAQKKKIIAKKKALKSITTFKDLRKLNICRSFEITQSI